jgi:hypothetical protein
MKIKKLKAQNSFFTFNFSHQPFQKFLHHTCLFPTPFATVIVVEK